MIDTNNISGNQLKNSDSKKVTRKKDLSAALIKNIQRRKKAATKSDKIS